MNKKLLLYPIIVILKNFKYFCILPILISIALFFIPKSFLPNQEDLYQGSFRVVLSSLYQEKFDLNFHELIILKTDLTVDPDITKFPEVKFFSKDKSQLDNLYTEITKTFTVFYEDQIQKEMALKLQSLESLKEYFKGLQEETILDKTAFIESLDGKERYELLETLLLNINLLNLELETFNADLFAKNAVTFTDPVLLYDEVFNFTGMEINYIIEEDIYAKYKIIFAANILLFIIIYFYLYGINLFRDKSLIKLLEEL